MAKSNRKYIVNVGTILVLYQIHPITQKSWSGWSGLSLLPQHFWSASSVGCDLEGLSQRAFLSSLKSHWGWDRICPCSSGKGHQPPKTVSTWVVAVDVVLLLDPHICWNCTLISANVSMMTAMKTFWKKDPKPRLLKTGDEEVEGNRKQTRDLQKRLQNTDVIRMTSGGTFTSQARKKMSVMK